MSNSHSFCQGNNSLLQQYGLCEGVLNFGWFLASDEVRQKFIDASNVALEEGISLQVASFHFQQVVQELIDIGELRPNVHVHFYGLLALVSCLHCFCNIVFICKLNQQGFSVQIFITI